MKGYYITFSINQIEKPCDKYHINKFELLFQQKQEKKTKKLREIKQKAFITQQLFTCS